MAEGGQPCRDGVYGEPPRDPVESRRIGGRSQDSHIRGVELLSGAETSTRSAPYRLLRLREGLPSRRQRDVERAMDRPVPAPRAGSHRDGRERYGSQRAVLLRSRVKRGNGTGRRNSRPLFRYWAWKAGLGWIGKNTNLIIPGKGSFFFLGEIVTTLEADQYDTPQKNRCGSCSRCLDACPTGALEGPRHLNARKCLSYLTIENRGEIPAEQASRLGNRLYGCDTCQEVCPWNRFARPTQIEAFRPKPTLLSLRKEDLKVFSREDYNRIFTKSAVKRAKYEGLIRNIHNLKD